jgi:integrase
MFADEFGDNALEAFSAYQVRNDLTDWRDQFIATPRTADYIMRSVSAFFGWARSRGLTDAEPVRGIRGVHKANRSDVIWTRKDFHVIRPHCSKALYVTLRFAGETGLRQGDLIALTWDQIDADTIQLRTRKTGGIAIVPLTRVAKAILKGIDSRDGIVLRGASGRPWTSDGLGTVYQKARTKAGIRLRWHDLRGTAATRFRSMGFTNEEVATAMGWSVAAVEALMVRYVKSGDTMRAAIDRVQKRKNR